jgi:DNA-binding transcriptional MerR regulator
METGYSIGQLAKAAGVPVKTLRYYSNIGLLEPAAITEAKYRRYRDRDVVKVALIRSLRSLGFSLDVIREVMHNRQTAREVVQLQLAVLESQRRSIQRQIAVLRVVNGQSTDADVLDQVRLAHAAASLSSAERDAQIAGYISQLGRRSKKHLGTRLIREIALADLPEELNPAQLEAWIRLSAIMQDPSMQRLQRRAMSSFPATGSGTVSPADFHASTTALTRQIGELAAEGASSSDSRVRALAVAWAKTHARAFGQRYSRSFMRRLHLNRQVLLEPGIGEMFRAISLLHDWPPIDWVAANRLLFDAVALEGSRSQSGAPARALRQ